MKEGRPLEALMECVVIMHVKEETEVHTGWENLDCRQGERLGMSSTSLASKEMSCLFGHTSHAMLQQ